MMRRGRLLVPENECALPRCWYVGSLYMFRHQLQGIFCGKALKKISSSAGVNIPYQNTTTTSHLIAVMFSSGTGSSAIRILAKSGNEVISCGLFLSYHDPDAPSKGAL
jgi:hypothetical protein